MKPPKNRNYLKETQPNDKCRKRTKRLLEDNEKHPEGLIDFSELDNDGETWEQFARDFLKELGFVIESSPARGADNGKDMIVRETIKGKLSNSQFRWLVSCKNFVKSNKSVSETIEQNILERCKYFSADGFMGFYSTKPSTGLNSRVEKLKENGDLKDCIIFDNRLIESYLLAYKCSGLILRYFPESYKKIRPVHKIFDDYMKLKCDNCGTDLLLELYCKEDNGYNGIVAWTHRTEYGVDVYKDCFVACKDECYDQLERELNANGDMMVGHKELADLARPNFYLQHILEIINRLNSQKYRYEDKALNKEKLILKALAQKVFHEVTEEDRSRFHDMQIGL